ncbi:hypothetical protein FP2506_11512 [Fulvimarina pelagi HTCC2506]|uniref:Insertion element IS150 protein InsJ-like helix-turn-helix domain-containing protein n=1 Tax=Fulvimarina pelagi HTCC2506 TaxID=314231 RepID=Q0FYX7_9HYPH|nr:helix-turn-helix domain-containing protein [Fulvimarina pelagi]EAU40181.1 hypothetical protein FP2506_11512 [Fulvimarina pelagi HTCC2506]
MTLPALLEEIAEVAGEEAAMKLAAAHGGTRRYIPGDASDGHWLPRLVGREAANRICAHFSHMDEQGNPVGQQVLLPLGATGSLRDARRRAAKCIANGGSAADAARAAGLTERTAYRIRRRMKAADDRQGDLFS